MALSKARTLLRDDQFVELSNSDSGGFGCSSRAHAFKKLCYLHVGMASKPEVYLCHVTRVCETIMFLKSLFKGKCNTAFVSRVNFRVRVWIVDSKLIIACDRVCDISREAQDRGTPASSVLLYTVVLYLKRMMCILSLR